MCGIVTIVKNKEENSQEILQKMLHEIKHRGPDHTGSHSENNQYSYGMTRLSIIDLSSGQQPIFASGDDGEFSIVFNGEIYNYKDLRRELLEDGYEFKTSSDTEVILNLYRKYKKTPKDFLKKLRGMFAFSIYDKTDDKIFVARDFFGIKPLYYLKDENSGFDRILAFGSEIKSLLLHPEYENSTDKINMSAVKNYLSFQYNPLNETFFKGIYKLDPGCFIEISQNTGEAKIDSYFDFSFLPKKETKKNAGYKNLKDLEDATFDLVEKSVKYHLEADVPIGAFLSGGVDSFITTAMIRKINPEAEIHTFTIGGVEKNEFEGARTAANLLKTNHHEIKLTKEKYFKNISKMIWHFDEPVADPAGYALYFLAQEASKKVKVVLAGEGADEFFGGYGIYKEPIALFPISSLPSFIKKPLSFLTKVPFNYRGKNFIKRAITPIEKRYIGNANIFKEEEIQNLWKKNLKGDSLYNLNRTRNFNIQKIYKKAADLSDSTKMQYVDIKTWLIGDILQKGDKMSMAQSLEVRTPFLDRVVADFARKIPDKAKYSFATTKENPEKIPGQDTKYLLRKVEQRLSQELSGGKVPQRKRLGFVMPLFEWLQKDISKKDSWKDQILHSSEKGFFSHFLDPQTLKKLIDDFENVTPGDIIKEREFSRKIFTLLILNTWHEEFFGESKKTSR